MDEHAGLASKEGPRYLRDTLKRSQPCFQATKKCALSHADLKPSQIHGRTEIGKQPNGKCGNLPHRRPVDGRIYIGSAYGGGGLGTLAELRKTGHGGNKLLKGRDPKLPMVQVRTLSTTMSPRDVIRVESHEKRKHGSRAIGLNGN